MKKYIKLTRSILFLVLVFFLQANMITCKKELGGLIAESFKDLKETEKQIKSRTNISVEDAKGSWLHRVVLYALKTGDLTKIQLVFDRIIEDYRNGKYIEYQNNFPNSIDQEGWTPLGLALKEGDKAIKVIKFIAAQPFIDINKVGNQKDTSLLLALKNDHYQTASCLLSFPRIDIATPDKQTGETPFHVVAKKESSKSSILVDGLFKNLTIQRKYSCLLARDKRNRIPIDVAAEYKNRYFFKKFFEPTLRNKEIKDTHPILFKGNGQPSIFTLAYFPAPSSWSFFSPKTLEGGGGLHQILAKIILEAIIPGKEIDRKMFRFVLHTLQDYLVSEQDWNEILSEISYLYDNQVVINDTKIDEIDRDLLFDIVRRQYNEKKVSMRK